MLFQNENEDGKLLQSRLEGYTPIYHPALY